MTTAKKLTVGGAVIAAVSGYMAYVGASSSWQYYLSVDECLASSSTLVGRPLRVSGRVASEPVYLREDRREATFLLKGQSGELCVHCSCPLPDNLSKDKEVVVEGRLARADLLRGTKVLTRCASKYESKDRGGAERALSVSGQGAAED